VSGLGRPISSWLSERKRRPGHLRATQIGPLAAGLVLRTPKPNTSVNETFFLIQHDAAVESPFIDRHIAGPVSCFGQHGVRRRVIAVISGGQSNDGPGGRGIHAVAFKVES